MESEKAKSISLGKKKKEKKKERGPDELRVKGEQDRLTWLNWHWGLNKEVLNILQGKSLVGHSV